MHFSDEHMEARHDPSIERIHNFRTREMHNIRIRDASTKVCVLFRKAMQKTMYRTKNSCMSDDEYFLSSIGRKYVLKRILNTLLECTHIFDSIFLFIEPSKIRKTCEFILCHDLIVLHIREFSSHLLFERIIENDFSLISYFLCDDLGSIPSTLER